MGRGGGYTRSLIKQLLYQTKLTTVVRDGSSVNIPALAILMVCCS